MEKASDNTLLIKKSALGFISGTLLSRVSGLIRDMSMAFCFGTDATIAAFLIAFRFANLLRRIFGEGALLTSFIPHFESYRNHDPKKAALFFRDLFFSLIAILLFIIGTAELGLWSWFHHSSPDNQQVIFLTMLMLPGVLFICLYSLCSGLLHCEKNFFLSGSAPIAFNVVWIASVWLVNKNDLGSAVIYLSLAITLAFFFQWFVTLPNTFSFLLRYLSWREFFKFKLFSHEIRLLISSASIALIGVSAGQINSAIDTLFARYASLEGPAYLSYAIHLQQLPLALFGIAMSTAILPPLSRAIKAGELERYSELLQYALFVTLFLLLPCTIATIVLGGPAVNLIYGRGDFSQVSTIETTSCLLGYAMGLLPMGIALLLNPAYYAKQMYWLPTLASIISIAVNICLNAIFILWLHWPPASLALSTSLAACVNVYLLFRKLNIGLSRQTVYHTKKIFFCSVLAGLAVILFESFFFNSSLISLITGVNMPLPRDIGAQLTHFFALASCFILTFILFAWSLKLKITTEITEANYLS